MSDFYQYDQRKLASPPERSFAEPPEPLEYGIVDELLCDTCGEWKPEREVNGAGGGTIGAPQPRCFECMRERSVIGSESHREVFESGV